MTKETYTPANSINKPEYRHTEFELHRYEKQRMMQLNSELKLEIIELKQQINELKNETNENKKSI